MAFAFWDCLLPLSGATVYRRNIWIVSRVGCSQWPTWRSFTARKGWRTTAVRGAIPLRPRFSVIPNRSAS